MKKSLLLLVFAYLGLAIGVQGQTSGTLPSQGTPFTIDPQFDAAQIVMVCESADDLGHVTGCKLSSGVNLDTVINKFIDQIREAEARTEHIKALFQSYIDTINEIISAHVQQKPLPHKKKALKAPTSIRGNDSNWCPNCLTSGIASSNIITLTPSTDEKPEMKCREGFELTTGFSYDVRDTNWICVKREGK